MLLALGAHPTHAGVAEEACAAVANLSFAPPHHAAALRAGAREAVLAARTRFAANNAVRAQADFVIAALDADPDAEAQPEPQAARAEAAPPPPPQLALRG